MLLPLYGLLSIFASNLFQITLSCSSSGSTLFPLSWWGNWGFEKLNATKCHTLQTGGSDSTLLFPTPMFHPPVYPACFAITINTLHHQQGSLSPTMKSPRKVLRLILYFLSLFPPRSGRKGDWFPSIIFVQIDLTVFRSGWSTKIGLNPQNSILEFYLQIHVSHYGSQADTGTKQMTPEMALSRPKLGVDVGNSQAGCRTAIIFQLIFSFCFLPCSR